MSLSYYTITLLREFGEEGVFYEDRNKYKNRVLVTRARVFDIDNIGFMRIFNNMRNNVFYRTDIFV